MPTYGSYTMDAGFGSGMSKGLEIMELKLCLVCTSSAAECTIVGKAALDFL